MTTPDEFHGVGGSYLLDPKTGKRTRVEEPTPLLSPDPSPQEGEGGAQEEATAQPLADKPRKGVR